jgi:ParB family chromosome partitioning protein
VVEERHLDCQRHQLDEEPNVKEVRDNRKSEAHLAPAAIGVKWIRTEELTPNPHNPRTLFDRVPLEVLRDSIAKVGILVPLTVYWSEAEGHHVILDGQRRWMCAKELRLEAVPVNQVAEPNLVQNIVVMFQIHKLREDWELMPTALKLEVLMDALQERSEKKLAELTGLDRAVVSRCKKLLSYPKRYQDLMLDPNPDRRIKADFFIELYAVRNDRFVNQMGWFKKEEFTERMLQKYVARTAGIKAVTDFRTMKQHVTNARRSNRKRAITQRLREFTYDDSLPLAYLAIEEAHVSASARRLQASAVRLEESLRQIDVQEFYGEEMLWDSLEKLWRLIGAKLRAVGRRLES